MVDKQTDQHQAFLYNVCAMLGFGLGASLAALNFHYTAMDIVQVVAGSVAAISPAMTMATVLDKLSSK